MTLQYLDLKPTTEQINKALRAHGFSIEVFQRRPPPNYRFQWDAASTPLHVYCSPTYETWEVSLFDYSGRGMTLNDALTDFRIRLIEERLMLSKVLGND